MAKAVLGETIDIHAGGLDLIFPHHENEIAQSECAHGKPMARYWLHNGFLSMDSEKMSKSLGNVKLIHDLLKHCDGETMRFALMSAHYRQPLDWTEALLDQSKATLDRLYNALRRMKDDAADDTGAPDGVHGGAVRRSQHAAGAGRTLGAGDRGEQGRACRLAAHQGPDAGGGRVARPAAARSGRLGAGRCLGCTTRIDALVAARVAARKAKDFAEADRIRKELAAEGIEIMDGPDGSTWRRV